jgi:putative peptidoglycan lipid II flippase
MSVSAAELPQMSSVTGTSEEVAAKLRDRLRGALRQITFFVVPSMVAFFAIGDYLVAGLYQRGMFSGQSTIYVWYIVMGYSIGLVPATLGRLYSSVFYSFNDTRTPLRFAIVRVVLTATLGALLAFPLRPMLVGFLARLGPLPEIPQRDLALGAVGLAAGSGLVGWVEFALLRSALRRRIESVPTEVGFLLRVAGAAVAAGVVASFSVRYGLPRLHPIAAAAAAAGIFGVTYLAIAFLIRLPEVGRIVRVIRGR